MLAWRNWVEFLPALSVQTNEVLGIDMSIEGLRSHTYSVAIFIFLVMSLIAFGGYVYIYMTHTRARLKTGEKVMFGVIISGMVIALVFGYLQLMAGVLF